MYALRTIFILITTTTNVYLPAAKKSMFQYINLYYISFKKQSHK